MKGFCNFLVFQVQFFLKEKTTASLKSPLENWKEKKLILVIYWMHTDRKYKIKDLRWSTISQNASSKDLKLIIVKVWAVTIEYLSMWLKET